MIEPDLARRRKQQISAADHLGHPGIHVINNHRQLVGKDPVSPIQDKIANRPLKILPLLPLNPVNIINVFIRHP